MGASPGGRVGGVSGRGGRVPLFCMITCLIYFTSKKKKKAAMTEPICGDPGVSVRQRKGRLQ